MRDYIFLIFALTALPSFGAEGDYTKAEMNLNQLAIIKPNEYKIDEVPKFMGVGWLALVKSPNGQWSLMPTNARNKKCSICGLSDREITSSQPNALFLLRHQSLKPGPVLTPNLKFPEKMAGLYLFDDTKPIAMKFNGNSYYFAWGKKTSKITTLENGEKIDTGQREVILIRENQKQIIGKRPLHHQDEGSHMLAWVGDLDNDGLLDFIIGDSFYNGSSTCLYLSSLAMDGKIVKRVSCYQTSGC